MNNDEFKRLMREDVDQNKEKILEWIISFSKASDDNRQEIEDLANEIRNEDTTPFRRLEAKDELKAQLRDYAILNEQLNEFAEKVEAIGKDKDIEAPIDWNAEMSEYWRLANGQDERGDKEEKE